MYKNSEFIYEMHTCTCFIHAMYLLYICHVHAMCLSCMCVWRIYHVCATHLQCLWYHLPCTCYELAIDMSYTFFVLCTCQLCTCCVHVMFLPYMYMLSTCHICYVLDVYLCAIMCHEGVLSVPYTCYVLAMYMLCSCYVHEVHMICICYVI